MAVGRAARRPHGWSHVRSPLRPRSHHAPPRPWWPISALPPDRHIILRHGAGDRRARATFSERYLPLARRLALRYRHSGEPIDDLIQVASLGVVKAADRWDPA